MIPESGICLEEGMATHSSILAWRIPWTEEPGELQSIGWQGVGHDGSSLACACTHTHTHTHTAQTGSKIVRERAIPVLPNQTRCSGDSQGMDSELSDEPRWGGRCGGLPGARFTHREAAARGSAGNSFLRANSQCCWLLGSCAVIIGLWILSILCIL